MSSSEVGFVYVHGAGLDTWIWDDLTQLQDTAQLSVSFPGREGGSAVRERFGLQEYVDHVCRQVEEFSMRKVVIVSHSVGGVVGLEAASRLRERVAGFVGVCAAIPRPGESFLSCYPFHQRLIREVIVRLAGTKPPDSAIRDSLCTGLSEEHTSRIIAQFTPESRRLFTDDRNAAIPDVPTLYVKTTSDKELSSSLQDTMSTNLGADEVRTIESGHMPMLSNPRELAEILEDFREGGDS